MSAELDKLSSDVAEAQRDAARRGTAKLLAAKRVITIFVEAAVRMPGDLLFGIRKNITDENSNMLLGAARSAAIWSVREADETWFPIGFGMLLLENGSRDYRESITEACLMLHSAKKIGSKIQSHFDRVKRLGDTNSIAFQGIERLIIAQNDNISSFGYAESFDGEGSFTYKQIR